MKKLKLTFHGKDFYARLLTEEAKNTVALIESAGAFESRVGYAKLANREFFFQTPVFADEIENPTYSEKGHVIFYPPRQSICVFYDDLIPLGYSNQFAVIEDEKQLEELRKEADMIWEKQGDIIRVEVVEE